MILSSSTPIMANTDHRNRVNCTRDCATTEDNYVQLMMLVMLVIDWLESPVFCDALLNSLLVLVTVSVHFSIFLLIERNGFFIFSLVLFSL